MSNKYFILHLSLIDGIGPATLSSLLHSIGSDVVSSDLYSFSVSDWINHYGLRSGIAEKLVHGLSSRIHLDYECALIDHHAIQWTTLHEPDYPALLKEIYMPPPVLYWQGGMFDDERKHLAIVGSRASTAYGMRALTTMIPDFISAGFVIVSGGAIGIDTIAHDVTVRSGGKTIAVLGSGLLHMYPASNKNLFRSIIDHAGMVISAYSLRTEAKPGNFPARNRIISGLCQGTLIAQAAEKSGSLITARYAIEQGREIFAIPGAFDDPLSVGCNLLIQAGGAKLVSCADDVINEIAGERRMMPDVQKTIQEAESLVKEKVVQSFVLSPIQKLIINLCKKPLSCDDIVLQLELDISIVQAELFALQLDGKIQQDFSGMWLSNNK